MDKILRNVSEQLWREVKSKAALEDLSMKDWVERALAEKLKREDLLIKRIDRRRKL
jgi:predicted HicB family RNase H-like nuclease